MSLICSWSMFWPSAQLVASKEFQVEKFISVYIDPNGVNKDGTPYNEVKFISGEELARRLEKHSFQGTAIGLDAEDNRVWVVVYIEDK